MRPALRTSHLALLALSAILGCQSTFLPLKNRITPGVDAFVVFVADGQADAGELWAGQASGGAVYQVTYTLSDEDAPALSPSGGVLAYTRAPSRADSGARRIWFMNLVSGNERELPALPDGAVPTRLAFSADGLTLYVRTTNGLWSTEAPPAVSPPRRLAGSDSARADSALTTFLGEPAFAVVGACVAAADKLCVFPPGQAEAPLQEGGFDAVHWGADSIGYLVGDRLLVRSGGGGRVREVTWARMPSHPRRPTYAPAAAGN